jgi:SAM-dependent methyltransferase
LHNEAMSWVAEVADRDARLILDMGGRDVGGPWGGSPRALFAADVEYVVLDIEPGGDVTVTADAATWVPDREYDMVIACELFEHTPDWPQICATAFKALRPGGRFVATMAGPGRPPHGALGGPSPGVGEHYANIKPYVLRRVLEGCGFRNVVVDMQFEPSDVRTVAMKS